MSRGHSCGTFRGCKTFVTLCSGEPLGPFIILSGGRTWNRRTRIRSIHTDQREMASSALHSSRSPVVSAGLNEIFFSYTRTHKMKTLRTNIVVTEKKIKNPTSTIFVAKIVRLGGVFWRDRRIFSRTRRLYPCFVFLFSNPDLFETIMF